MFTGYNNNNQKYKINANGQVFYFADDNVLIVYIIILSFYYFGVKSK